MLGRTNAFQPRILMLEDMDALSRAFDEATPDVVIHLAAQAGVRYSLENPRAYCDANLVGTFNVLEAVRACQPRMVGSPGAAGFLDARWIDAANPDNSPSCTRADTGASAGWSRSKPAMSISPHPPSPPMPRQLQPYCAARTTCALRPQMAGRLVASSGISNSKMIILEPAQPWLAVLWAPCRHFCASRSDLNDAQPHTSLYGFLLLQADQYYRTYTQDWIIRKAVVRIITRDAYIMSSLFGSPAGVYTSVGTSELLSGCVILTLFLFQASLKPYTSHSPCMLRE